MGKAKKLETKLEAPTKKKQATSEKKKPKVVKRQFRHDACGFYLTWNKKIYRPQLSAQVIETIEEETLEELELKNQFQSDSADIGEYAIIEPYSGDSEAALIVVTAHSGFAKPEYWSCHGREKSSRTDQIFTPAIPLREAYSLGERKLYDALLEIKADIWRPVESNKSWAYWDKGHSKNVVKRQLAEQCDLRQDCLFEETTVYSGSYTTDMRWEVLDKLILALLPDITFAQYLRLTMGLFETGVKVEHGYYGDVDTYHYRYMPLIRFYDRLTELNLL